MSKLTWINGQAFANFKDWECYQSGFWHGGKCKHDKHHESSDILNSSRFMNAIQGVFLCWPITAGIHMTNPSINRKSWIGQNACFFESGNCADCTVRAWHEMTEGERKAANYVANEMVMRWNKVNLDTANYPQPKGQLELAFVRLPKKE